MSALTAQSADAVDRARPAETWPLPAKLLLCLIFIAAVLIRIPGLFTEFWLDEIWSWYIAGKLHSVSDLLFADIARVDNNHLLNTLWLYLLGPSQPPWFYRLPSLVFGCGSVAVAAHLMRRRGTCEAVFAAGLIAFSFPQVFYASEARGYAPVVFFAVVAIDTLELSLGTDSNRPVWCFAGTCVFGFLSHLTFLHVYAGALVASCFVILRRPQPMPDRIKRLRQIHLIPMGTALLLHVAFISHLMIGGAAPNPAVGVVINSLSTSLGGPQGGWVAVLIALLGAGLFVTAILWLLRRSDLLGMFSLVAVLVCPGIVCGAEQLFSPHPQPLMIRYFLAPLAVALLPIAWLLAKCWRHGTAGRAIVTIGLSLFLTGNAREMARFTETGRGQFATALLQIRSVEADPVIRLACDNPARTGMLLEYYAPLIFPNRGIKLTADPQPWLLLSGGSGSGAASLYYQGVGYELIKAYPRGDFSGLGWWVYRRKKN